MNSTDLMKMLEDLEEQNNGSFAIKVYDRNGNEVIAERVERVLCYSGSSEIAHVKIK